jgi:UDP-GlcNAc:undecaprenyl-phosphate/decaprenyl-phosphate GlcNAc-1-phosphate transferase
MQGEYVLTLLAAAAVTYLLTPLVRRFAIAAGASHAARARDVHEVPTPLLGGFAMYAGLVAGLLVASRLANLKSVFAQTNMAKGLLLAGALVVIMGFVDDRWGMGAVSKLAGQVAAGVILVWSGAEVTWLPAPFGGTLVLTSDEQIVVTILVVVMTINAVNFIDGLDGLAAGIVGIGAASFFIYYYTLTHRLGLGGQTGPALVSAVLAGVCLGFLPHNFHPARIFMGDTGAMLIGLLLAYAPISSLAALDPNSLTDPRAFAHGTVNRFGAIMPLLLPAAILLIPYTDLLMAVVRRTRAGLSPFAADRKHLHHRMLEIGHSHRTSVLIMYLWAGLFAGSVVWLSIIRSKLFVFAIITVVAMLALLFMSMPRLRPWNRAPARNGAAAPRGRRRMASRPGPEPDGAALPAGAGSRSAAPGRRPADRLAADRLAADRLAPDRLAADGVAAGPLPAPPGEPVAAGSPVPATTRPAVTGSGAGNPGAGNPGAGNPGAGRPGAGRPGARRPGAGNPGAGRPAGARPAPLATPGTTWDEPPLHPAPPADGAGSYAAPPWPPAPPVGDPPWPPAPPV